MSKFLSFIHFRNHLVCFGIEPKELFGQTVDEARERPSIGDCLFVRNVKVKVVPMNRFIARQAASIANFFMRGLRLRLLIFSKRSWPVAPASTASFSKQARRRAQAALGERLVML